MTRIAKIPCQQFYWSFFRWRRSIANTGYNNNYGSPHFFIILWILLLVTILSVVFSNPHDSSSKLFFFIRLLFSSSCVFLTCHLTHRLNRDIGALKYEYVIYLPFFHPCENFRRHLGPWNELKFSLHNKLSSTNFSFPLGLLLPSQFRFWPPAEKRKPASSKQSHFFFLRFSLFPPSFSSIFPISLLHSYCFQRYIFSFFLSLFVPKTTLVALRALKAAYSGVRGNSTHRLIWDAISVEDDVLGVYAWYRTERNFATLEPLTSYFRATTVLKLNQMH